MQGDNPLWYDYVEPDEPPSRTLLVLAGLFNVILIVTTGTAQLFRAAIRLWRCATYELSSLRKQASCAGHSSRAHRATKRR